VVVADQARLLAATAATAATSGLAVAVVVLGKTPRLAVVVAGMAVRPLASSWLTDEASHTQEHRGLASSSG
jgi:hypothetical protein